MSGGYRFKRADALVAAKVLLDQIMPQCVQVQIAGSLRRGKHSVGDIEVVALPVVEVREVAPAAAQLSLFGESAPEGAVSKTETISHLDQRLDHLVATGAVFRERPFTGQKGVWGEKRKQFWLPVNPSPQAGREAGVTYITVDLYIVTPPAQWGSLFTIRTGDADFTGPKGLMKWINERTSLQQIDGRLIVRATGDEIETPTERAYFRAIGLPWIEPRNRDGAKMQQMLRMMRAPNTPFINPGINRRDKADIEAKSGAHPDGGQDRKPVLSIQIRALLERNDGLTRDALLTRLKCDSESLALAVSTLTSIGDLTEDEQGGLHLVSTETIPVKAITVHQPYATLIAYGVKHYETRSWPTNYRGLIAIHAGKTALRHTYNDFGLAPHEVRRLPHEVPLGSVVAVARLKDCLSTNEFVPPVNEMDIGNFAPNRYAWQLEVVTVFDPPIPARGQQGLWDWDGWDGVIEAPTSPGLSTLDAPTSDSVLGQRIKDRLVDLLMPLHRTSVKFWLGCSQEEFNLALESLKARGEVIEDQHYCLHRPDVPFKRSARPPKLPGHPANMQVVNVRNLPAGWQDDPAYANHVYIGRANPSYRLPMSPYHNPFKLTKDESRGATLDRFEAYLRARPDLIAQARRELRGKTLVCWCAPQPCHGDVLVKVIQECEHG